MSDCPWSDEQIETLKSLKAEGYSNSAIASALGGGLSRNAVIGKCARLGLSTPRPVRKRRQGGAKNLPDYGAAYEPAALLDEPEPLTLEDGTPLTLLNAGYSHCRWPKWPETERENFVICAHQRAPESSYCEFHRRLSVGKGTYSERSATKPPTIREPEAA